MSKGSIPPIYKGQKVSDQVKGAFQFVVNRNVINLYKRYINLVEDLQREHNSFLKKVEEETSKEFVEKIDYFTPDKYNYIRKKILDLGNEGIRDIEKFMDLIEVDFKEQKNKEKE
jgi:hypothetical protein